MQNYSYDSLNRLDDAVEYIDGNQTPSWRQDFSYDRYGNRNFVEANTTFEGFDKLCANNTELCAELRKVLNPSANASDNRLSSSDGYVFDTAGNTVRDPQGRRFTYDGEDKQVMVETLDANGNPVSTVGEYSYDGDGRRIKKHVPSTNEVTVFVYDATGKLIGEYSTIAETQSPKVSYTTADHLVFILGILFISNIRCIPVRSDGCFRCRSCRRGRPRSRRRGCVPRELAARLRRRF